MTQGNVGNPLNAPQPCLIPVTTIVGTSAAYGKLVAGSFYLGTQIIGQAFNRSNAGVAMTDSLPNPAISQGDQKALPNGWNIVIYNIDATAAITLTPVGGTVNGQATLIIAAGNHAEILTDGINYFSRLSSSGSGNVAPLTTVTGGNVALGTYASGSIILRSNATVAMADTLPNANTLPNGWWIEVFNVDTSSTDTITPATSTINGGATLAITHGQSTIIRGNGVNYFATTPA